MGYKASQWKPVPGIKPVPTLVEQILKSGPLESEYLATIKAIESRDTKEVLWHLLAYSFKASHLNTESPGNSSVIRDYIKMLNELTDDGGEQLANWVKSLDTTDDNPSA